MICVKYFDDDFPDKDFIYVDFPLRKKVLTVNNTYIASLTVDILERSI